MQELFDFISKTEYAQWLTIASMLAFVLSHIVAWLPVQYTEKIPDIVMQIVNRLAANYRNAANEKTDVSGNSK